jgi:hypothetical protein
VKNNNCDGSGPCHPGAVRLLPTGNMSNAIYCRYCFEREMSWRKERNRDLGHAYQFKLPEWDSLNIYSTEVK